MTAATGRRPRRASGYTLMEIMIALVIIGTLVAITRSRLDAPRYKVDAAIQMFRNAFTQAQRTALLNQYDVIVVIDTSNQSLKVVEDANNNGAIDTGEHTTNYPLTDNITFMVPPVGLDSTVTSPVVGSQLGSLGSEPTITFRRDGAATSDLQLYIATPAQPTSTYRALKLVQSTGRSDWYLYNSTANTWVIGGLR